MNLLKIQLLLFFFFTTGFFSQSNSSGIIHYESEINSKKLKEYMTNKREKIKSKGLVKSLDKIFQNTNSIKSKLVFSDGKGLFKVEDKLSLGDKDLAQKVLKTASGGSNEYYYNTNLKSYLIKECGALGECFIYPNTFLEWKLTQETKIINGFDCYKGTRSNGKVIAWYAPSIPVSFGPKGEYGLPGLILELERGKIIFKATKIVLNPKEGIKIEKPKAGRRVSKEEYTQIIKKAKKSVFGN
jgi:GLPGLI family protein